MVSKQIDDHKDYGRNSRTKRQKQNQYLQQFKVKLNAGCFNCRNFFPRFPTIMLYESKCRNGNTSHNNPQDRITDDAFVIIWYGKWKKSSSLKIEKSSYKENQTNSLNLNQVKLTLSSSARLQLYGLSCPSSSPLEKGSRGACIRAMSLSYDFVVI